MIWNIQFQLAGLILCLIVAGMCLGQKKLNFAAEKAYIKLLVFVIISIVSDVVSIFAINYREYWGDTACTVLCKFYLLTATVVACQMSWFAVAEIRYSFNKLWVNLTAAPLAVELLVLIIFPINVYKLDGAVYTYGIPVYVAYGFALLYVTADTIMVICLRNKINAKRKQAIFFCMGVWLAVIVIQFVYNELLIISFAMAVACVYIYCKLENPEYHIDFASNVFNKFGFSMIMAENIKYGVDSSLVIFSIDELASANEIFGASIVEKLVLSITEFADGIPNATLFRLEDNLFCLSFSKTEEAEKAVEQIYKRMSMPFVVSEVKIDVSVHVAMLEKINDFKSVEDLEEAIHYFSGEASKRSSDDIFNITDEQIEMRKKNIETQHALEWAFRNDAIEVYFQPIYSIQKGKFVAMEALSRIRDKNGSIIEPADFIGFSEKNGMILRLGETVFRKTCEFMQRMHIEAYGIEFVEVNLSTVQCMQEDMSKLLKDIMGEYQIAPYKINFEITETAASNSKATIRRMMDDLIAYGSGFSLDDYGSGYSNLSYVVNLPLKLIKLDKLLVDNFFLSDKVRTATEYTIEMLHKLGMEIVVEGVETEEQYLQFKKLGVEYVQGYYFSKPLPRNQILNYVQEWL